MKAQELRIGNWVRNVYSKHPFQVYPMWFKQLPTDKDHNLIVNNCEPIPLTEKWLIDFGFGKHQSNPFWFRRGFLCISLVGKVELITWDHQIFKIEIEIKHIHQLQNLYFALTGEELQL